MCVAESALLRVGGLCALLETTAVSQTAENARDKLRVVHVAEAEEQCILLAEVEVQTRVKCVAVFIEFGRIGEIRENLRIGWEWIEIQQFDGVRVQTPGRKLVQYGDNTRCREIRCTCRASAESYT